MSLSILKKAAAAVLAASVTTAVSAESYTKTFSETPEGYEITFSMAESGISETVKDGVSWSEIELKTGVSTTKKGYAELPVVSATIQIDNTSDIKISYVDGEYREVELKHPLLPSKGPLYRNTDPSSIPYETDPASLKDPWYPENAAETTEPFIFRDTRGVSLYAYPVVYNAAAGKVRIYKEMRIGLVKDTGSGTNPLSAEPKGVSKLMDRVYGSLFINYNTAKFAHQISETGDILVICTARDEEAIQPYIDWKRQKGYEVNKEVVDAGRNVKSLIASIYAANPELLYVQLVGDWADIKSDTGADANAPMDPMLGCVSGTDLYPELIIGRFSAGSAADVTVQVDKTINYEKNPELGNTWYKYGLGIGSNEGAGIGDDGEIDYDHIDIIKENKLLPFTYSSVAEAYSSPSASTVAGYINAGLSIINYCGHGSETSWGTSGYSNTNVNASTNGSMLPVIFSVACVNGAFHTGTCFAEAWLRKAGGGAAATLMSTINQPWVPPMRGQDYMNDILTGGYNYTTNPGSGTSTTAADARTTFGSVAMNGCVLMLAESADSETQNTIRTWTVFGDASLQVRTDTPKLIENTNKAVFPELYTTSVMSSGEPVEGAAVSIYQNGISASGVTDANGEVSISHNFSDGEAVITVSGFNLETLQDTVSVQPPDGPYLKVEGYSFSSTFSGETVAAEINIKNIGLQNSSGVSLNVTSESPYISIINGSHSFEGETILPDSSAFTDGITFSISSGTPDQERIKLSVEINDEYSRRSYGSDIYITVGSPDLKVTHLFSSPSAIQGMSRTVTFSVVNEGHAPIYGLTASLAQTTGFDIGISEPVQIDSIAAGETANAAFECYYSESIPNSSFVVYDLTVTSGSGYEISYGYEVVVGLTDGFETGDFHAVSWLLSGDTDWIIDSEEAYEGNFSANSGTVGDGQKSVLTTSFNFITDGNISFFRKTSTEAGYDKLNFYIDGSWKKSWSGISDWLKFVFDVPAGIHEFKWEFSRDGSIGNGSNCVWIDNLLATGIETGICEEPVNLPQGTVLHQNYPNPFNPATTIRFSTSAVQDVNLSVFNVNGQKVAELVSGKINAGMHTVEFDGSRLNSGVYYIRLSSDSADLTGKMILIK